MNSKSAKKAKNSRDKKYAIKVRAAKNSKNKKIESFPMNAKKVGNCEEGRECKKCRECEKVKE